MSWNIGPIVGTPADVAAHLRESKLYSGADEVSKTQHSIMVAFGNDLMKSFAEAGTACVKLSASGHIIRGAGSVQVLIESIELAAHHFANQPENPQKPDPS